MSLNEFGSLRSNLPDSDIVTYESTHGEGQKRDPFQMNLLEPLLIFYPNLSQSKTGYIKEDIKTGLEYLRQVSEKAQYYFDEKIPTQETVMMGGLFTHVYGIGEGILMPKLINDWVKKISEGEVPGINVHEKVGKLLDFVVNKRDSYLDFVDPGA
jgi:hypothetical protein